MNENLSAVSLRTVSKYFTSNAAEAKALDDVSLDISEGEFFTLLGPSGCGKTTTLRLIAGFEMPSSGEVWIGGVNNTSIPPFRRRVNTVFQSYALFPHLTVEENIAFGLSVKKVPKAEHKKRVEDALRLVRLSDKSTRRPRSLSGGQQQRVALARALVNRPSVLLLDEPLGALDLQLRKEMQVELRGMQKELAITFVLVTHDQEEALTMSDRIAVMSSGHVLQIGSPSQIYEQPSTAFGARFIGEMNFLDGSIASLDGDEALVEFANISARVKNPIGLPAGAKVSIAVRPECITLAEAGLSGPGQCSIEGVVENVVYRGVNLLVIATLRDGSKLSAIIKRDERLASFEQNGPISLCCSPSSLLLYPHSEGSA